MAENFYYSSNPQPEFTRASEVFFSKSSIELQDDLTGFLDSSQTYDFYEVKRGNINMQKPSLSDPMNGKQDDMITYFNLLLTDGGNNYTRDRYDLIDLLEQQGGLT